MVRVYKTMYNFRLFIKENKIYIYRFFEFYSDNEQSKEEKKVFLKYQIPSAIQHILQILDYSNF